MEFSIRKASELDAFGVKELERMCGLSPWTVEDYAAEATRMDSVFLVAARADGTGKEQISGFLLMRLITKSNGVTRADTDAFEGEILNLAVAPDLRRNGIAAKLLASALLLATPRAIEKLFLEVRRSNLAAQRFYAKAGFIVSGERKGFYSAPYEDALLMTASADKVLARFPENGLVFEI